MIECGNAAAEFIPGKILCPPGGFIAALEWSWQADDLIRQVEKVIGDVVLAGLCCILRDILRRLMIAGCCDSFVNAKKDVIARNAVTKQSLNEYYLTK